MLPASVPQVVEKLRVLFGRPGLFLTALLNRVRLAPAPMIERLETMIKFGMELQGDHVIASGESAHTADLCIVHVTHGCSGKSGDYIGEMFRRTSSHRSEEKRNLPSTSTVTKQEATSRTCPVCEKTDLPQFLEFNFENRRRCIHRLKACRICLNSHGRSHFRLSAKCGIPGV